MENHNDGEIKKLSLLCNKEKIVFLQKNYYSSIKIQNHESIESSIPGRAGRFGRHRLQQQKRQVA
jgi:hypothetical protein